MRIKLSLAAVLVGIVAAPPVAAQTNSGPLPANTFITFGGLDWAWASPCFAGANPCDGFGTGMVLVDGFRFATVLEWASRPDPSAFLDPLGNFFDPFSRFQMRCAAGWFDLTLTNCDYNDATAGLVSSGPGVGGLGDPLLDPFDETWVVRGAGVSTVPEPATLSLLGTGLVGLVGFSRRRKA